MKKLLFILISILILQGGFKIFAVSKKNFAELLTVEKKEGEEWKESSEFLLTSDSVQSEKIYKFSDFEPDFSFGSSFKLSADNDILYLACEFILRPKEFYIFPGVFTYEKYKIIISPDPADGTIPSINYEGTFDQISQKPFILQPGRYTFKYSIFNEGIEYVSPKTYLIFAGQSPKPELGNPNYNYVCVGDAITIPIFGKPEPGTTYTVTYSDDKNKKDEYSSDNLPNEIKYTFEKNSCGANFETTGITYKNAFGISLTAKNDCGEIKKDAGPIYVSSEPKSTIKAEQKACVDTEVTFENSDEEATVPDQESGNCTTSEKRIWIINPAIQDNNYEIIEGNLGTYTDKDKPITWFSNGDNKIKIKFYKAGNYTVTLKLANDCFQLPIEHPITIEPKITPDFSTVITKLECGEGIFEFKNKTILPEGLASTPTFKWTIPDEATLIDGTLNSENIKISVGRGNYIVILTYDGTSCEKAIKETIITVKGKPEVKNISDINACIQSNGPVVVKPVATIESYGLNVSYNWTITMPDGTTQISNLEKPEFTLTQIGNYKVKLILNSEDCGNSDPKENKFVISPMPIIDPVDPIVTCEGKIVNVEFKANDATTGKEVEINGITTLQKFYWTNDNPDIGLPISGYGKINFTAINNSEYPNISDVAANITVFPLNLGCQGEPISFKITVNPSKETAPHDSIVICAGDPIAPLKAVYNGVENNPAANYQWYSTDGVRDELITGATSWQFTPDNKNWGTFYYYCKITPRCDDPQQPCCDPFNSQNDTITILPKGIIKDTLITVAKSVNTYNLTPVNGVNQNVIPEGTKYKWTILSQGYGSIIGVTEHTNDLVDNIFQTFNLPDNFALPYDSIVYQVTAISGSCQTTYKLTVRVVPGITANVICNDIKCFGETGSIEIKDIFGIMNGNTIIRLLDKNNNDNIINVIFTTNNNHTFTNLAEGNYKISIFDENGVSIPYQVSCSLVEPSGLIFVENQTKAYDVKCKGDSNGEIYVKNTGGTGGYKYLWEKKDVITGNFVTYTKYTNPQELKNLSVGDYRLTVTDDNACTVVKEFTISEPSQLYFSVTGSPVLNCDDNPNKGGSIVVSSPGGGIVNPGSKYFFTWTKKNQTNESSKFDLAGINSVLSNIQEGTYIIGMYDDNGCYIQSPEIKIDRAPALVASVDSLLVFDCENHRIFKQYTVTSSGGVGNHTVRWFDGETELATGNTYVPDNSLNKKLITVKVTDSRDCVFTLTVTPFVLHLPVFDFKFTKTACNKYQFEAISPENVLGIQHSFKWNFSGQDSGQGKATEYDLDNLQVNSAGEYYVELIVLDNFTPCEYPVVRKTFKKNFIPDMKISSTGTVETVNNKITVWYCEGDTITVFGENANAYSWSNGSSKDNIKINHEGQFTLWGKNSDGCEGELNFETRFYKFGYEIVTDKDEINLGETVAFSTATFVPFTINYLWNFGDGTMNSTIELPYEHTYHFFSQDYFDILLTATNPKGCKEYATKRIKVNISSFPNTIMPGSIYEENRVFMKGCQVQIYNRNSVLIHEGADGWDGTHNGKPVMSDTYFYVLTYTQATGVQQTKKGYVTVIR